MRTSRSSSAWSGDRRRPRSSAHRAIRPSSVAAPVATTIPSPSPADDARSARRRSTAGRPGRCRLRPAPCDRCSGIDSPVRTLRSSCRRSTRNRRRSAGTTSPPDSRTTSPGTRLAAVTCTTGPVPPDAGHRCAGVAQRLERPLAAVLGDDVRADDRDQADEHEQAVADLAEEHRPGARREEQEHERLRGRLDDEPPHARPPRRLQLVWPDPRRAPRRFGGFESGRRVDVQPTGNRRGGQGVRLRAASTPARSGACPHDRRSAANRHGPSGPIQARVVRVVFPGGLILRRNGR